MSETFQITQGAALTFPAVIRDTFNAPITTFTGSEPLTASVWPGETRAALFSPTAAWVTPGAGSISIHITAVQSAGVEPGQYELLVRLTTSGQVVDAYTCTLEVLAASGATASPASYVSFQNLTQFAPRADRLINLSTDESGFALQCAQASREFDRKVLLRYNPQVGRSRRFVSADGTAGGPYLRYASSPDNSPAPTRQTIAGYLGTAALLVNADILEAVAREALAVIYQGEPGAQNPYGASAPQERNLAMAAFRRALIEIDTNADGIAEIRIDQDVTYLT